MRWLVPLEAGCEERDGSVLAHAFDGASSAHMLCSAPQARSVAWRVREPMADAGVVALCEACRRHVLDMRVSWRESTLDELRLSRESAADAKAGQGARGRRAHPNRARDGARSVQSVTDDGRAPGDRP